MVGLTVAIALQIVSEDVFVSGRISGQGSFDTFRIPALCRTRKGTLLAFAEGRESVSDQAANALVLRRKVRGQSGWTPLQVIGQDKPNSLNNPCVLATKSGRVWMMYQRYPAGLNERSTSFDMDSSKTCRTFVVWSDDDGKSWSHPREITKDVKSETTQSDASGPGNAIELERGSHKGRFVFPLNEGGHGKYDVFAVYSDDRGKTWRRSKVAPKPIEANPNETQIAELSNGDLYMNARNQGARRERLTTISHDGGQTWEPVRFDPYLPDPVCQGSVVRLSFKPDLLVFSNANSARSRENGTLRVSLDGGNSWSTSATIEAGSFAYSSLCRLSDKQVGVLFENVQTLAGNREIYRIRFKSFAVN